MDLHASARTTPPAWLLAAAAAASAAIAGLWHLGTTSFWYDESFSVNLSRYHWGAFLHEITHQEGNQSGYFLLLKLWPFRGSEVEVRLLSVLLLALTAAVMVLLGVHLWDRWLGLAAGLATATTPFALQAGQEARGYALLMLASAGSTLALVRATQGARWGWPLWAVAVGLMPYAHLYGVLIVAGQLPWALRRAPWRRVALSLLAGGVVAGPILLWALFHRDTTQISFLQPPGVGALRVLATEVTSHSSALLLAILVLAVLGSAAAVRRHTVGLLLPWLALTPLVLLGVSRFVTPIYQDRYLAGATPALCLLLAYGVRSLPTVPVRSAGLVALVLVSLLAFRGHAGPLVHEDWRGAAAYIRSHEQPGDVVVGQPCIEGIGLGPYASGVLPSPVGRACPSVPSPTRLWVVGRGLRQPVAGRMLLGSWEFTSVHVQLYG